MKKRFLFLLTFLLTTVALISGCSQNEVNSKSVKVIPSDLFQGDTVRLEPHMNMVTGCVDVEYQGDKENIMLKYEIWEEGTLKMESDTLSTSIKENEFNGEISISLKDINDYMESSELMELTAAIRTDSGYFSNSIPIDRYSKEYANSPSNLEKEINATEDEEISIWGLIAGDTLSVGEDIEKSVKESKWGLIVKLYFD